MSSYLLRIISSNQTIQSIALDQLVTIPAESGSVYSVIDAATGMITLDAQIKQQGDQLIVEVEDELVARIDGFYAESQQVTFDLGVDGNGAAQLVASGDAAIESSGVVWEAATDAGAAADDNELTTSEILLGVGSAAVIGVGTVGLGNAASKSVAPPPAPAPLAVVDTTAPTATANAETINNTASTNVLSTEVGTAYLVNNAVPVNTLADITGAATDQWNSVAITVANTPTALAAAGLIDGGYKVYTVDAAGNVSVASTQTVTIDNIAPAATATTGNIPNTASTNVKSTEVGTAYLVKDTVTVNAPADITGAATDQWNSVAIAAPNINTALAATGLITGGYKVYSVDAAGNLSAASIQTVTIDATAPTATATTEVIQSAVSTNVKSTEAGDAYLVNNTVNVNNTLANITGAAASLWSSVAIAAANTNTALDTTGLIEGGYKLYTVDAVGNLSAASTQTVTIDNTAPTTTANAESIQSVVGTTVESTEAGTAYLVKDTVTVNALADITGAAGLWSSVPIGANTPTPLDTSTLPEGGYKLYAVDAAGNLSAASTNTVTIDNTPPTATATAETIKNTASTIVQSTEVGTAYLVKDTVAVSIASAPVDQWNSVAIAAANTNTVLAATGLIDGTYKVYTTDAAGNVSAASTNTVTIDTSPPTATATAETISSTVSTNVQSTEVGTAYLVKDTVVVNTLADITGAVANEWNSVAIAAANTNTALAATGLITGGYKVYTVDAAGNLSAASTNTVNITPVTVTFDLSIAGNGAITASDGVSTAFAAGVDYNIIIKLEGSNAVNSIAPASVWTGGANLGAGDTIAIVDTTTGTSGGLKSKSNGSAVSVIGNTWFGPVSTAAKVSAGGMIGEGTQITRTTLVGDLWTGSAGFAAINASSGFIFV